MSSTGIQNYLDFMGLADRVSWHRVERPSHDVPIAVGRHATAAGGQREPSGFAMRQPGIAV